VAFFLTNLHDDILFVASSPRPGVFQNVDETRRLGVEANAQGRVRAVSWFLSYSFTQATFESTASFPSAGGKRERRARRRRANRASRAISSRRGSMRTYRGDSAREPICNTSAGSSSAGGTSRTNTARSRDYVVVNARLSYTWRQLTLFARAENLFDTEYETFGVFGENTFAGGRVERFLSPGSPLGGWFGMRIDL